MAVSKHLQLFPMGTDMKMMIDTVDFGINPFINCGKQEG